MRWMRPGHPRATGVECKQNLKNNEASAAAEAWLLSHMVNELERLSSNFGKSEAPNRMQRWLIKFVPFRTT